MPWSFVVQSRLDCQPANMNLLMLRLSRRLNKELLSTVWHKTDRTVTEVILYQLRYEGNEPFSTSNILLNPNVFINGIAHLIYRLEPVVKMYSHKYF